MLSSLVIILLEDGVGITGALVTTGVEEATGVETGTLETTTGAEDTGPLETGTGAEDGVADGV